MEDSNTAKRKVAFAILVFAMVGCGRGESQNSELKIIGGTAVEATDPVASSTVALVNRQGQTFCTGSLITPVHVVTAGHCLANFTDNLLIVAFGTKGVQGEIVAENLRAATKALIHPEFSMAKMGALKATEPPADIAMLELNDKAPDGFTPVAVLRKENKVVLGEELLLAGYGRRSTLINISGELYKVSSKLMGEVAEAKEIQFGKTPGKSACYGDSGGPAFVKRGKQLGLVGVTSRGLYCYQEGVYTDVRQYVPWLVATIQSWKTQPAEDGTQQ